MPNLENELQKMHGDLSVCQSSLRQYLETQRETFPRFYFVGDDDLMKFLRQSTHLEIWRDQIHKIFNGVHTVQFTERSEIEVVLSDKGESLQLRPPVPIDPNLCSTMKRLESSIQRALRNQLGGKEESTLGDLSKGVSGSVSQMRDLNASIHFTREVESAIVSNTLESLKKRLEIRLASCMNFNEKETSLERFRRRSFVMDTVYHIQIIESLIEADVTSKNDWEWRKQLRFYVKDGNPKETESAVFAEILYGVFDVSWEFLGSLSKLIHTALTDRCFLVLSQAMVLGLGGHPFGPAGTGKTETVKALGHALGRSVLVFNCDEDFDFKSMERIFAGLVACGFWGCFDEFNRLEPHVLSSVAQHLQIIQARNPSQKKTIGSNLDGSVAKEREHSIFG